MVSVEWWRILYMASIHLRLFLILEDTILCGVVVWRLHTVRRKIGILRTIIKVLMGVGLIHVIRRDRSIHLIRGMGNRSMRLFVMTFVWWLDFMLHRWLFSEWITRSMTMISWTLFQWRCLLAVCLISLMRVIAYHWWLELWSALLQTFFVRSVLEWLATILIVVCW